MKRKLSLLLAVVMILGSFSFAFAADFDPADFLEEKGILVGDDSGDLMKDQPLLRKDSVVLLSRLLGEEEAAKEFEEEGLPTWEDVKNPYYVPYLAWAQSNEHYKGHSTVRFGYDDNLTAKEYATVLLRALGYAEKAEDYSKVLEEAKELGLLEGVEKEDEEITRAEMAQMTVNALKAVVKDSEETLAEKLGIEFPAPTVLEVVDVKADNLKEVVVTFNKAVDADTVTDANVQIKDVKGTAVASEDGMSVIITVNDKLENQKEYKLIVENVKGTDGVVIAKTEKAFKPFDATLPEVNEVVVTGPKSFSLVFSEPIEKAGKVEVKLDKTTLGNKVTVDGNKATVDVFTNFVEDKEYTVTVSNFEDFAGYKNVVNTLTFTYVKDTTPPVATVVKAEQEYVVVEFNKPVKGLKVEQFYHTFNAWNALGIYSKAEFTAANAVKSTDSVTKVYVNFNEANNKNSRPLPEGNVRFGIIGKDVKDNWGNALGEVEFNISVAADKVAPEATLEVEGENAIKVKFTKSVEKLTLKNVEVLDKDGKKITGVRVSGEGKEYTITLPKSMAGKVVTVILKDVVDTTVSENKMPLFSETIEITDKTSPALSVVYHERTDKGGKFDSAKLIVVFSEEVDGDTALVASNYSLIKNVGDKKTTKTLSKTPYFDLNSARVIIPLTKDESDFISAGTDLLAINVKDLAGNVIKPLAKGITGGLETTTTANVVEFKATAKDKLVLKFDDILSDVKKDNFELKFGTEKYTEYVITQSEVDGVTVLEFELEDEKVDSNAKGFTLEYKKGEKPIKNSFGKDVEDMIFAGIKDEIAPTLLTVNGDALDKLKELTTTGNKVTVTLEFDEDLTDKNYFAPAWVKDIEVSADVEVESYVLLEQDSNNKNLLKLEITFKSALEEGEKVGLNISIVDEPEWLEDPSGNKVVGETVEMTVKYLEAK